MNATFSLVCISAAFAFLPTAGLDADARAPQFEITRYTIDGGGAMFSTGGDFELSGTVGQPDAGPIMTSAGFELTGGFWFQTPRGDCDHTCGVDLLDYAGFEACLTGPGAGVTFGCGCFDVNLSGTVDQADYAVVQTTFTGP